MPVPSHVRILVCVLSAAILSCTVRSENGAPVAGTPRPLAEEAAVLENGRMSARQRSLARLASHPDPGAAALLLAQFDKYRRGELPPPLWLDLFEAAARRDDPRLKELLAERERELAKSRDPLERFRECLEGGDGEAGRVAFEQKPEAGCVRCHSIDGKGGQIGPDLTWLRRSIERVRILESLLVPNATIAPGFHSASLTLKNGESVVGVIHSDMPDEIVIAVLADGKKRTIRTADIASREALPSPMPPHFGAVLDKRTIRDLVEFIAAGD